MFDADVYSILNPQGRDAAYIANLWWFLFGLGALVYLGVLAHLGHALFRRRRTASPPPATPHTRSIVWGGVVMPAVVLTAVFGFTVHTLWLLSSSAQEDALTIQVVGRQWWWEVHYPAHQVTTANELYIPAGQSVQVQLDALDVIHSFWTPSLHGKLDMIPGRTNRFWLTAERPGDYRGICAEFCGIQHAKMGFVVVAVSQEEFTSWLAQQTQPAAQPADPVARRGQEIFLSSTCIQCHTIKGTSAAGKLGPDLTHLASRRTLGAGVLPNNRGNLGGWLVDPQHIKPGNLMPASVLSGEELNALLAYLETLE